MSSSSEEPRKMRIKAGNHSRKAMKEPKPTKKKTKERMDRKETKRKKSVATYSHTTLPETDDEKENLSADSALSLEKCLARFQDMPSPELVREAQYSRDYHFDSPVRQRRQDTRGSVWGDLEDWEIFLGLKGLPDFQRRSKEKDELLVRKDSLVIGKATKKDRVKKFYKKVIDSYRFPQPEDSAFGRTKTGAPKMRLNEYLQKCRIEKALESMAAYPSSSKHKPITFVPEKIL